MLDIRKLNQQYEQQHMEEQQSQYQQLQQQEYNNKPANRREELDAARKRMAREAEEVILNTAEFLPFPSFQVF